MKQEVYKEIPRDLEDLRLKIINAFNKITPEMLRNTQQHILTRLRACRDGNGAQIV